MSSDIKKTMWKAMSDSPKVMVSLVIVYCCTSQTILANETLSA